MPWFCPTRLLALALCLCASAAFSQSVNIKTWPERSAPLNEGWKTHSGDNPAWAASSFDDSSWDTIAHLDADAENTRFVAPGVRWYRIHLRVGGSVGPLALELYSPGGGTEVWVNGQCVESLRFSPVWARRGRVPQIAPLPQVEPEITVAVRTYQSAYESSITESAAMTSASIGTPAAIVSSADGLRSRSQLTFLSGLFVDLALVLAGIGLLLLYRLDRSEPGYFWLGLYLIAQGIDDFAYKFSLFEFGPDIANSIIGDPGGYAVNALLVEFVFRFVRRPKTPLWRVYQWASCGMVLVAITVNLLGILQHLYAMVETLWAVPIILLLPLQLLRWGRQGNREAALLVVPVCLIALSSAILEVGYFAGYLLHITTLLWMFDPIQIGPFPVRQEIFAYALFLLTIGAVMVLRFQRVSRAEAHSAAELEAARLAQRRLVPETLPLIPACTINAAYYPAAEVGGDFYQVLTQTNGSALIVVGDVSGKGLKAAMTGVLAIGALRTLAAEDLSPAQLLLRLNRQMMDGQDGGFVTCICASLDGDQLTVANAGHLAPYLNGKEMALESGLPLGLAADSVYAETQLRLQPGLQLTLMTDGVVEAQSLTKELFGFDRTAAISTESAEAIAQAAQSFGQEDDITVLTLTLTQANHG